MILLVTKKTAGDEVNLSSNVLHCVHVVIMLLLLYGQ